VPSHVISLSQAPAAAEAAIEDAEQPSWTAEQLNILQQIPMFEKAPTDELEKLPFDFKYQFRVSMHHQHRWL